MAVASVVKKPAKRDVNHPSTWDMVKTALVSLHDKTGSSRQALVKYICSNYNVQMTGPFKYGLNRCLNKAVSEGKLVKTKASFKLSVASAKPTQSKAKKMKKTATTSDMPKQGAEAKTTTGGKARSKKAEKTASPIKKKAKGLAKSKKTILKK